MVLTWVDLLVILVVVGFVLFEVRHDFGRALLDSVAVLLSVRAAGWLWPAASRAFPLAAHPELNRGLWYLGVFVLCAALGLVAAHFIHQALRWTLETFDPVFGFIFGMTSAIVTAHVLVKAVAILYRTKQGLPACIVESALGQELLTFKTYRHVMEFLHQFPPRV